MKSVDSLIDVADSALPLITSWLGNSARRAQLWPCAPEEGARTLHTLQVTTRSLLGALAYHTGGLVIDDGWLRVLGAGCAQLPRSLVSWNNLSAVHRLPGACLVADDAVGGFFAINGNAFQAPAGLVFYLSPDTLNWENTERTFPEWLYWALTADLNRYYESIRWPGWHNDISGLPPDHAIHIHPPLWARGPNIAERSRRAVPLEELWHLHSAGLPSAPDDAE